MPRKGKKSHLSHLWKNMLTLSKKCHFISYEFESLSSYLRVFRYCVRRRKEYGKVSFVRDHPEGGTKLAEHYITISPKKA